MGRRLGIAVGHAMNIAPSLTSRLVWERHRRRGDLNALVIDHLVSPGDSVVDVGASLGIFSGRLLRAVGPQGSVFAVEPQPENAARLRRLAKGRSNFQFFEGGASDQAGEAVLRIPISQGRPSPGLATLRAIDSIGESAELRIALNRLDDLVPVERRPISFMKIDVEGHESNVLAGADAILADFPSLLIEIMQQFNARPIHEVFDVVLRRGYVGYGLFRDGLRPIEDFDLQRDQLAHDTGGFADSVSPDYVYDFLFVAPGFVVPSELLA